MTTTSPATAPETAPRTTVPAWVGVVDGLVAGLLTIGLATLGAALMSGAGATGGTAAPVAAVSETFVDLTPPWLKDFAVSAFGTNDKRALLIGVVVVLAVATGAVGVLAHRRLTPALVAFAVLGAVGIAAVMARPGATALDPIPTLVGVIVGLWYLRYAVDRSARQGAGPRDAGRRWLVGGVLGGAAAWAGSVIGGSSSAATASREAVKDTAPTATKVPVPAGADLEVPGLTPYLVPNADFYRIDTAIVVPRVDATDWKLTVTGMVDRDVEIDWNALQSKPMEEALVTLTCVSNAVGGPLIGNAVWTGWPVRELLAMAGPKAGADMVLARSVDGWTCGTPLAALTDERNALVAIRMNGEPLPFEHGFPARLVVPGLYGYVSACKWVTELKVTTFAQDMGYWTPRGWSAMGPVKTSSRIDVPTTGATVAAGRVAVAGVAWAQHRGIAKVEVQVDDGPWTEARLAVDASIDTWRQWVYEWNAPRGSHTIRVRATDATGKLQSAVERPPAPNGAEGLHTINVNAR
jgi:DMSO/TMAO reductase YedYZ molybdopterin-dependent catalytic subunit